MNYVELQKDLLRKLRGKRSRDQLSRKLNYGFNQVQRWESGRTQLRWTDFVRFCEICRAPLRRALKEAFSFAGEPARAGPLVRHFSGTHKLSVIASHLGVSTSTVSRWMSSELDPSALQIFALLNFASADFMKFLEILSGGLDLPSIKEQIRAERTQLQFFYTYPWLSALLSALDLPDYRRNPTTAFLTRKSHVAADDIEEALAAMAKAGLLVRVGKHWETRLQRIGIRGSVEERKCVARYIFDKTREACESGFGNADTRFSWKQFSFDKSQQDLILEKWTEFFNEVGTIIDAGQPNADRVGLMSFAFVDFDAIRRESKRENGPAW